MKAPLDPALAGMLAFMRARRGTGRPTVAQARSGLRALAAGMRSPASVVDVGSVEDVDSPRARVYRPVGSPIATVVFFHGGGFVIGDLDTHDHLCRLLCREVGAVVVSVAYRLAPEDPYPAAVEDCVEATRWALKAFAGPVALAGDSAGATLAAVVAQAMRDEGGPPIAAQLLICPATDLDAGAAYPSRVDNADGFFLTADDMRWFAECYLGTAADVTSARVSPLRGTLAGLPPAVVVTAEYDPLRDEGEAYVHGLVAAGVPVRLHRFDGLIHGFFDFTSLSPACSRAVAVMCASFRDLLNGQVFDRDAVKKTD